MKNILILYAFDPLRPTGITRLVRQLCSDLAARHVRVMLAMPALAASRSDMQAEWEAFANELGTASILWWDRSDFTLPQRERLVHNLERLHARSSLDHIFAIGIAQCGFVATIAARLLDIPFSVFITYRDALCYHSLQPQEIELSVTHAFRIVTTNPHVLHHVKAFHQVENRMLLLDPRPDRKAIRAEVPKSKLVKDEGEPYLVTTGHLDQFMHLPDLVERIRSIASQEALSVWRHVGGCCPATKTKLESLLKADHSPVLVHDVEVLPRHKYVELISNAAVHVIPQGESDTNSAAYESEVWGVKTSYPGIHCFPALRQRKRTIQLGKRVEKFAHLETFAEDLSL